MAESENISVGTVEYGKDKIATLKTGKYIDLHTADRRFENDLKITITAKVFDGSVFVEGEPNAPGEDIGIVLQEKIITENGEYTPDDGYDGLSKVIVNVEGGGNTEEIDDFLDEINGEVVGETQYIVTFIGANGEQLCQVPVYEGDTCEDPVSSKIIQKPTKASTVDTTYEYIGWSLTDGGSADTANALANVTEDRTLYAVFKSSVRKYTVSFYDGETFLKTERIAYGGSSTYELEKENYIFLGWEPACNNVVSNITCYAQWRLSDKLTDYTWEQISAISESGEAATRFLVGDTKPITMKIGTTTHTLTARLLGFNHDDLADGTGKAGMSFEVVDMAMTGQTTASGRKYETSAAWTGFDQNAHTYLGSDLKPYVKQVAKKCYDYSGTSYYTLNAYMWRLAVSELGYKPTTAIPNEGEAYRYYDIGGRDSTIGAYATEYEDLIHYGINEWSNTDAVVYALRTPANNFSVCVISHKGACITSDYTSENRFVLGFCI